MFFHCTSYFFRLTKMIIVKIINTTFFQNVSQFVIIIASPKQPQSDTGLKIARNKVRMVKKLINKRVTQAVIFRFVAKSKENPRTNSNVLNKIANGKAINDKNSNPKAVK